jgi:hypothetical protein
MSLDDNRRRLLLAAFSMPTPQSILNRKSSITNAFVNAIIPVISPTAEEIEQALDILGLDPADLRCSYCGDQATEWDHLRPLVLNQRPTGYISEIANLVPACGKCNQSKGNKEWRIWMQSPARRSPTGRGIDVTARLMRLDAYERWRTPTRIHFEGVVGTDEWTKYWALFKAITDEMRECQEFANTLRARIAAAART